MSRWSPGGIVLSSVKFAIPCSIAFSSKGFRQQWRQRKGNSALVDVFFYADARAKHNFSGSAHQVQFLFGSESAARTCLPLASINTQSVLPFRSGDKGAIQGIANEPVYVPGIVDAPASDPSRRAEPNLSMKSLLPMILQAVTETSGFQSTIENPLEVYHDLKQCKCRKHGCPFGRRVPACLCWFVQDRQHRISAGSRAGATTNPVSASCVSLLCLPAVFLQWHAPCASRSPDPWRRWKWAGLDPGVEELRGTKQHHSGRTHPPLGRDFRDCDSSVPLSHDHGCGARRMEYRCSAHLPLWSVGWGLHGF